MIDDIDEGLDDIAAFAFVIWCVMIVGFAALMLAAFLVPPYIFYLTGL